MLFNYSMVSKVLILTEAGKNIGFGHYSRCSALRQALISEGIIVQMMLYLNKYDIEDSDVIKTNWLSDIESIPEYKEFNTVIVDSYLADLAIYSKLQTIFRNVVAIDDYNRINYPCSVLINPNVFFSDLNYSNQTAKCLGGEDYVILRPEFRNQSHGPLRRNQIEDILITIGGFDFRRILPTIIETCLESAVLLVTIIAPEGLSKYYSNKNVIILSAQDAESMFRLMQKADIVISACGQTLHELASLQKATIGICLDIDQEPNQKYYLKKGFLPFNIQWNDVDLKDKIKKALKHYKSLNQRKTLETNEQCLININGVFNIVSIIKKFI